MITNRRTSKVGSARERVAGTSPISIRSTLPLSSEFKELVRSRLARELRHDGALIERATVRFEDVNGPKGGVDTMCRIKLVLTHQPSIITEKLDTSVGHAFARAVAAIGISIRRTREKIATRSH